MLAKGYYQDKVVQKINFVYNIPMSFQVDFKIKQQGIIRMKGKVISKRQILQKSISLMISLCELCPVPVYA